MYNPTAATNKRMGVPLTASGFLPNTIAHLYGIAALGNGGALAVGDYVDGRNCGTGAPADTCANHCRVPTRGVTSTCGYAPQGSSCNVDQCSNANSGLCAADHNCVGATEAITSEACGANSVCGGTRCMYNP